jgi:hypothetical protein
VIGDITTAGRLAHRQDPKHVGAQQVTFALAMSFEQYSQTKNTFDSLSQQLAAEAAAADMQGSLPEYSFSDAQLAELHKTVRYSDAETVTRALQQELAAAIPDPSDPVNLACEAQGRGYFAGVDGGSSAAAAALSIEAEAYKQAQQQWARVQAAREVARQQHEDKRVRDEQAVLAAEERLERMKLQKDSLRAEAETRRAAYRKAFDGLTAAEQVQLDELAAAEQDAAEAAASPAGAVAVLRRRLQQIEQQEEEALEEFTVARRELAELTGAVAIEQEEYLCKDADLARQAQAAEQAAFAASEKYSAVMRSSGSSSSGGSNVLAAAAAGTPNAPRLYTSKSGEKMTAVEAYIIKLLLLFGAAQFKPQPGETIQVTTLLQGGGPFRNGLVDPNESVGCFLVYVKRLDRALRIVGEAKEMGEIALMGLKDVELADKVGRTWRESGERTLISLETALNREQEYRKQRRADALQRQVLLGVQKQMGGLSGGGSSSRNSGLLAVPIANARPGQQVLQRPKKGGPGPYDPCFLHPGSQHCNARCTQAGRQLACGCGCARAAST